jgi:hypothetical protein
LPLLNVSTSALLPVSPAAGISFRAELKNWVLALTTFAQVSFCTEEKLEKYTNKSMLYTTLVRPNSSPDLNITG